MTCGLGIGGVQWREIEGVWRSVRRGQEETYSSGEDVLEIAAM